MIRWYDWLFAIMISNLIMVNVAIAITNPSLWVQFIASITAYVLYDLWLDVYCKIRLMMERKNG